MSCDNENKSQPIDDPSLVIQEHDDVDGMTSFLQKVRSVVPSKRKSHKVKKDEVYVPDEFDWGDDTYSFSHRRRGLAIIINNEEFSNQKLDVRKGSREDVKALKSSFTSLGLEVTEFSNLKAQKMMDELDSVARDARLKDSDCFVCAICTHGGEVQRKPCKTDPPNSIVRQDYLNASDGKGILMTDITEKFNDKHCPALRDKPRLFFIQACRGFKYDDGVKIHIGEMETYSVHPLTVDDDNVNQTVFEKVELEPQLHSIDAACDEESDEDIDDEFVETKKTSSRKREATGVTDDDCLIIKQRPDDRDFLIMYATPSGYRAWRSDDTGSWFIQCLAKVLKEDVARSVPLHQALIKVNRMVAWNFSSNNKDYPDKKEMPVIESTLMKDVVFPSKT